MKSFLINGLCILALTFLTGCFGQPNITGTYTTAVNARSSAGSSWKGTAEILLTQTGEALNGNVTLHHPQAGVFQIAITSGSVSGDKVVFFGHTNLALGTVDVKFVGVLKGAEIEGAADVQLDSLFGQEHDTARLQLLKA